MSDDNKRIVSEARESSTAVTYEDDGAPVGCDRCGGSGLESNTDELGRPMPPLPCAACDGLLDTGRTSYNALAPMVGPRLEEPDRIFDVQIAEALFESGAISAEDARPARTYRSPEEVERDFVAGSPEYNAAMTMMADAGTVRRRGQMISYDPASVRVTIGGRVFDGNGIPIEGPVAPLEVATGPQLDVAAAWSGIARGAVDRDAVGQRNTPEVRERMARALGDRFRNARQFVIGGPQGTSEYLGVLGEGSYALGGTDRMRRRAVIPGMCPRIGVGDYLRVRPENQLYRIEQVTYRGDVSQDDAVTELSLVLEDADTVFAPMTPDASFARIRDDLYRRIAEAAGMPSLALGVPPMTSPMCRCVVPIQVHDEVIVSVNPDCPEHSPRCPCSVDGFGLVADASCVWHGGPVEVPDPSALSAAFWEWARRRLKFFAHRAVNRWAMAHEPGRNVPRNWTMEIARTARFQFLSLSRGLRRAMARRVLAAFLIARDAIESGDRAGAVAALLDHLDLDEAIQYTAPVPEVHDATTRQASKAANFGIMYGRGVPQIPRDRRADPGPAIMRALGETDAELRARIATRLEAMQAGRETSRALIIDSADYPTSTRSDVVDAIAYGMRRAWGFAPADVPPLNRVRLPDGHALGFFARWSTARRRARWRNSAGRAE